MSVEPAVPATRGWESRIVGHGDVAPEQLLANPRNWRVHPRAQHDAVAELLDKVGWVQDVIVNQRTGHVVDGHLRVMLAMRRQEDTVPVVYVDLSLEEELLVLAALDPLAGMAITDKEMLAALIADVRPEGALATLLGVGAGGYADPDDVPTLDDSPTRVKKGEVWQIGDHRLVCGDSTNDDDAARLMHGALAEFVMADPPYNVKYRGGSSAKTRVRDDAYADDRGVAYGPWLEASLSTGARHSDDKAALHLWHATVELRAVLGALDGAGWKDRSFIVWNKGSVRGGLGQANKQYRTQFEPMVYCHKRGHVPRWHGPGNESDVWNEAGPAANPLHPTMKPVTLYRRSIENHTEPGALVLELFGGSGTTLIAAHELRRRAHLFEIEPRYCDVILTRAEKFTGLEATRADG